jgi:hypothetical protein
MQHLKEFLTRIQTFDLRIIEDDIQTEWGTNEKKHIKTYDILYSTKHNDSTTHRSELRVLREMAFIDILTQDKERIKFYLVEIRKVRKRFQDFWEKYHDNYSEQKLVYERSFVYSVYLEYWFIVNVPEHEHSEIILSARFVEDLADAVKVREKSLVDLIWDIDTLIKDKIPYEEFIKQLHSKAQTDQSYHEDQQASIAELPSGATKQVIRYPNFKTGTATQLLDLLKDYFTSEEYSKLEKLLLNNEPPAAPLIFRGFANQLADAFKQLFDANLIVGCIMADLERWLAPKFLYLANGTAPRDLTEPYLHSLMSEKTRPCKSPIIKIEWKDDKFFLLPAPRNKK